MKSLAIILASLMLQIVPTSVWAQQSINKEKTIEVVIPFAPGGAATSVGQFVAKSLKSQGYNAVAVNRPGNNSIIAVNHVAKSSPNGLTVLIGTTSSVVSNVVFKSEQTGVEYDEQSLAPVVLLNESALGMIVSADSNIKTYDQLRTFVKQNPDKFNIGTYNANFGHIFKDWAKKEGLPSPTIVLYKGSAAMVTDVVGGSLLMAFDNFGWGAPMLPFLDSGKLRILATLDNAASKQIGKISYPVVDISKSHPDIKFSVWMGLFVPAGTPPTIIAELNSVINRAVSDPSNKEAVDQMDGIGGTVEQISSLVRRDFRTLKRFAK